ncbi:hypothetical protein Hanom_Chr08g00724051 [Helianthus anomalus]
MAANVAANSCVFTPVCCCFCSCKHAVKRLHMRQQTGAKTQPFAAEDFNFDEVEQDLDALNLKGGIKHALMKRYFGRKHDAKEEFLRNWGYDDVERAMTYHPKDMPYEIWL